MCKSLAFVGWYDQIFPQKMPVCDRATLRALQRFETIHGGSTNFPLSAACSDQDDA